MQRIIENGIYQQEEFEDDALIPTVIYVEFRGERSCIAGVWYIDHYEFENGTTGLSPWDEIVKCKGCYNQWWRIWKYLPTDEERSSTPWKGATA